MHEAHPKSVFYYRTSLVWERGRIGDLISAAHPEHTTIRVDLGGPGKEWTPGELFVGSIEGCMVATLLSLAHREGVSIAAWSSSAVGTIEGDAQGFAFSSIAVSVRLTLYREEDRALASRLLVRAHETCFLMRSLTVPVTLDYSIEMSAELPPSSRRA